MYFPISNHFPFISKSYPFYMNCVVSTKKQNAINLATNMLLLQQ